MIGHADMADKADMTGHPDMATPERTCVGCRKRGGRGVLVRLVAEGDHVVVDGARRLPGRGAWVHRDPRCVSRLAVGALERGLKRTLAPGAIAGVADGIARLADRERVELPSASAGAPPTQNGRPAEPK